MTVLITGATGFLGSHLAEQLSRQGRPVRALVRPTSDTGFLLTLRHVTLVEGSVDDPGSLERAVRGVQAIVHAAGLVKARRPQEFQRTNADGTSHVLRAALEHGNALKRLVYVSSQAVAGPSEDGRPVPIDAPARPLTHYARSKLAGERAVLAHSQHLPVTVIRPPAIYGPRDRAVLALFKAVDVGLLAVLGSAERRISLVFGADAAAACIQALEAPVPSGSRYYIDDGPPHRFGDLIAAVEAAVGKRAWLRLRLPRGVVHAAAIAAELYGRATRRAVMLTRDKVQELFAPHWVCDSSDTRRDLGWQPTTDLAEGARITAHWYRQHGWL